MIWTTCVWLLSAGIGNPRWVNPRTAVNGYSVTCTVTCLSIISISASCGGARFPGARCGRARHMIVMTTPVGRMLFPRDSRWPVWPSNFLLGLSAARSGSMPFTTDIRESQRMSYFSVSYRPRWCTTIGCIGRGCPTTPSGKTTLIAFGRLFLNRRRCLSVCHRPRLQMARALRTFAPVMRRPDLPVRHVVFILSLGRLMFRMFLLMFLLTVVDPGDKDLAGLVVCMMPVLASCQS